MAEVGVPGPCGNDQVIVRNFKIGQIDEFSSEIKAHDFVHYDFNIPAAAENPANRRGDLSGRNSGSRDLVEERLKCVVVSAINESDLDRQLRELASCFETAESGANYHYPRAIFVHADSLLSARANTRLSLI